MKAGIQILVVVANIQMETLKTTVEKRSNNRMADILMIDDPTGANSANTSFMRFLCTHIVDFNGRKLLAR